MRDISRVRCGRIRLPYHRSDRLVHASQSGSSLAQDRRHLAPTYSPAGWWHVVVSLPLLIILFLGWIWRLVSWTRLLWLISRLRLRLVASHPDHAAGLGFVGHSCARIRDRGTGADGNCCGKICAHRSKRGNLPTPQLLFNIGFMLVFVAALINGPTAGLHPDADTGLAARGIRRARSPTRMGAAFEDKWLRRDQPDNPSVLEQPDFSATTISMRSLRTSTICGSFPSTSGASLYFVVGDCCCLLVPVLLLAVPIDQILAQAWKGLLL